MLLRAAAVIEQSGESAAKDWSAAFTAAVDGVTTPGGAHPGDRTMVDALHPAAVALQNALAKSGGINTDEALKAAVDAATSGAAHTASMTPRLGRSSYVGDRALGFADPGAHAVGLWLAAIRSALNNQA